MSEKGLNPFVKDLAQLFSIFVALVVAIVTVYESLYQIEENRSQRKEELRWKKAKLAREVLKPFEQDLRLRNAMAMLDTLEQEYEGELIVPKDVAATFETLSTDRVVALSPKNVYIRNSFDYFFKNIRLLEHYLQTHLIDFKDIEYPLEKTIKAIRCIPIMIEYFGNRYEDKLAKEFIDRFNEPQCNRRF